MNDKKDYEQTFQERKMEIDFVELVQTAENYQPLKDWGFTLSAKQEGDPVSWLVYTSQWCKIKIHHRKDFHQQVPEDSVNIYYGRIHALDDSLEMEHEGQKYLCWLNSVDQKLVFKYLDGQSPEEAMEYAMRPQWLKDYLADKHNTKIAGEWELIYQKGYWDHYGLRLFELLDIRRPDLWDSYISFLKEYAKLEFAKEKQKRKENEERLKKIYAEQNINIYRTSSNVNKTPEIPLYNRI